MSDFLGPHDCSTPDPPVDQQFLGLAQTHDHQSVMPSNLVVLCHPLLLLPSIFPSIRVFSNESVTRIRCPNQWSFSFSSSPSNEYIGRDPKFYLGLTGLKSLHSKGFSRVFYKPQFKRINSSVLSFLYSPVLTSTHDYWKNHSMKRWIFVGKVVSLFYNMLPSLVTAFLPKGKASFNFMATVIICSYV